MKKCVWFMCGLHYLCAPFEVDDEEVDPPLRLYASFDRNLYYAEISLSLFLHD